MKKLLLCAVFISALAAAGGQLLAQEDCYLKFRIVDALGNADTVVIMTKDGAGVDFNPELGEINLYGVEPQGDLDLRIIQRTDTNAYFKSYVLWLCGDTDDVYCVLVAPYKNNVDLKTKYLADFSAHPWSFDFALKATAKHYPISIYALKPQLATNMNCMDFQTFDDNGQPLILRNNICLFTIWDDEEKMYTFNNSTENQIIGINVRPVAGIRIPINSKMLYPNPSNNFVILEEPSVLDNFTLINAEGILLHTFDITEMPYTLDISTLPNGTYYLINYANSEYYSFVKMGGVR